MTININKDNKLAYVLIVLAASGLHAFEIAKAAYGYYGLSVADGIEVNCRSNKNKEYIVISGDCDTTEDYVVIDKLESGKYQVQLIRDWEA